MNHPSPPQRAGAFSNLPMFAARPRTLRVPEQDALPDSKRPTGAAWRRSTISPAPESCLLLRARRGARLHRRIKRALRQRDSIFISADNSGSAMHPHAGTAQRFSGTFVLRISDQQIQKVTIEIGDST